jgi:hypothetical protein
VLKTIEELVKETTYLEVSVLYLFFQQTRRLKKKIQDYTPAGYFDLFFKTLELGFQKTWN